MKTFFPERSFPGQPGNIAMKRILQLVDIDLRWGVTEEDATRHKNIVKVCFNQKMYAGLFRTGN
jgi:hypothetical protein